RFPISDYKVTHHCVPATDCVYRIIPSGYCLGKSDKLLESLRRHRPACIPTCIPEMEADDTAGAALGRGDGLPHRGRGSPPRPSAPVHSMASSASLSLLTATTSIPLTGCRGALSRGTMARRK